MKQAQLIRANELDSKIRALENLQEHFERNGDWEINPIKEIHELLTGYNNLMGNISRDQMAKIMIESYKDFVDENLKNLRKEFESL